MLKKIAVVMVAVLLSLAALASVLDIEPVSAAPDWWPMFGHDPNHTGYSPSGAPDSNDRLKGFATASHPPGIGHVLLLPLPMAEST